MESNKRTHAFPLPHHPPSKLQEGVTDWTNPDNPTLEDLGVSLTNFDMMAHYILFRYRRNAYYSENLGEFADPEPPKPAEFYSNKVKVATA